jgi:hypothetical protein
MASKWSSREKTECGDHIKLFLIANRRSQAENELTEIGDIKSLRELTNDGLQYGPGFSELSLGGQQRREISRGAQLPRERSLAAAPLIGSLLNVAWMAEQIRRTKSL